ncbi:Mu transposase C-terminal domain-containing protein [Vogesella indigofera]|uniref:Mu transposase C-terminal domain-containing protein n=1 Tax=Vogesella indigofera TaxID=45465 RepID=UPI0014762D51|nr:DDE-type integrase/transposase/recombinase [Vogesella indigofera]
MQELLAAVTDRVYLTKQRNPIRAVHDALLIEISRANAQRTEKLPFPDYSTVRRYIRSLPCYDVDLARYGREYTRKKYRHSGISPAASYILERVEIDHTPLDLFVCDEETQLVLGRPYVSWMIDCNSRMIPGFYISFSPPSIDAVLRCLKHAIEPKGYVRERYPDIVNEWPCAGIPMLAVVDNGLEFHAKDLLRATFELGIHYQFCPPRTPWFKPMVERSLRSLTEQFAHLLPSTSFANWFDRYGYDPLKEGVVTMSELVHALHIWVIDVYAQSYHRSIKQTPYSAWKASAELAPPRTIPTERLNLILSQQAERVLGHAGIELHGLRYNCEELLVIRKQLGDRLLVHLRYDPENLGSITILHPSTKAPIPVPCLTPEYADGLALYQHRLIQKALRNEGRKTSDPLALAKAKVHMQDVVGQLVQSKKLSDRKKAARSRGSNSAEVTRRSTQAVETAEDWAPPEGTIQPTTLPTLIAGASTQEDGHE